MFNIISHQGNGNQNSFKILSYARQNGEDQKHKGPFMLVRLQRNCPLAVQECKLVQPLWKSILQFLRQLGMNLLQDTAIPLLAYMQKTHTPTSRTLDQPCSQQLCSYYPETGSIPDVPQLRMNE